MLRAPNNPRVDHSLTRIVATVGPACNSPALLTTMLRAGVSVFRLNMSHGDLATHQRTIASIRKAAKSLRMEPAILADLPGPKIRLTPMTDGGTIALRHGDTVRFTAGTAIIDPAIRPITLHVDFANFIRDVKTGDRVLIDDGAVQLRVRARKRNTIECVCEVGGTISGRKGVNLPESLISLKAPTTRDRNLARWAVHHGADFVALSFVEGPADIRSLKRTLLAAANSGRGVVPKIVAKIERPIALKSLDEIAHEADAMMVARGDLAIELDFARVPVEQRNIQAACERAAIPCIVATQMLQSMMTAPLPTRAEASDVAGAIFGGADGVMLSGETAAGQYPIESVTAMRRIAEETELWLAKQPVRALRARELVESSEAAAVLARSMAQMATESHARAIVVWTDPQSVRYISQTDVNVPIHAFAASETQLRSLALFRGVHAIHMERPANSLEFVRQVERLLCAAGHLRSGDRIVVGTGFAGRGTERLWLRSVGARAI